ncbi:MAG: AAA family ATPase [Pseudomonadota bacterium]
MRLDLPPLPEPLAPADGRIALDAALLKQLRKARGLSQEALAELCMQRQLAVSIASIKRAETGKVVLYRTARHLATVFDVELDTLVEAGAGGPEPAPPPAVAEAGLRYVIALHIALAAPAAPDTGAEIDAAVRRFGGRLEAHTEADLAAVFGLPQAYRSDAERALRCAIELAHLLPVHGGRALALRLERWHDGARAPQAAPPGWQGEAAPPGMPIYVARNLVAQLAGRFEFGAAHAGYLAFARSIDAEAAASGALIGRVAETGQFKALALATREARDSHIVYLRAMAGVGKSHLAAECAELARQDGYACHRCEVPDAGADSWRAPLGQLARSLFGIAAGAAPEAAIDAGMAELGLAGESAIFYRAVTGARMTSGQMSLYAAMSHAVRDAGIALALQRLVNAAAAVEPLLLTIEDLHWGERYLVEALGALLGATREAPVLWLLTSRIEHDPLEATLRPLLVDLPLSVFELAPLGARESRALADQFGDAAPAHRERCVERAAGNPLFLTQLLASPEHALPDSLKHVIQTRLDALAPAQQRALRAAAVIGNRFELELLRALLGEPDCTLEAAGRNALVRPAGPGAYVFVHDLVMHCIYESIDAPQLRRLHQGAATLYRERDPAKSAQHLYRAADPSAFDVMLRAIRDKLGAHQYEAALELTAECSANDSTRYSSFTLALLQAHATAGLGRMAEARRAYQHALLLAGRPQEKIDAVIGLATTLNLLEELDEEERLLDETLPLAHSINADAALGKLLHLKGNIYFPRGNYAQCRRHHEDAVRYARASGMSETEARALSGLGDSYYAQGHMQRAHELFGQCIAMCERHGFLNIEASNRSALGSAKIYLGQSAAALAEALASAELAHQVGNKRAEIVARMTAGWVLVGLARVEPAAAEVGRALELARAMGASRFEPFLMESEARIAWLRGEHALAERQALAAAEAMTRLKLQRFIGPWVLGTVALFSRDPALRKKSLLQGAALLTRDCLAHNAYRFYVTAAEVALLEHDMVSAGFYADQLEACAEPCAWITHHAALIRAYAQWSAAPGAALAAELRQLRAHAVQSGFAQATPRLSQALEQL